MLKSRIPLFVQFELTYQCNNSCIFCYNQRTNNEGLLNTEQVNKVLENILAAGVLGVNFNGGEPLMRKDFFDIASHAKLLGFDLHLNTNATLLKEDGIVRNIANLFPAICVSVLSGKEDIHNYLSGSNNAFKNVIRAITLLHKYGVYVAVNIMLSKANISEFLDTLAFLWRLGVETILVTRYIACGDRARELHVDDSEFYSALRVLKNFQKGEQYFNRVSLPQPVQLCKVPEDLYNSIKKWNIPCTVGLCTASIDCRGTVTPCNLVKTPQLGNLLQDDFISLWKSFNGGSFCAHHHLRKKCLECHDLPFCGGGCKGFNDGLSTWLNF